MSRLKAKNLEDEIMTGVGKILKGKEMTEDTVFAALEQLSKNVARCLLFENIENQVAEIVDEKVASQFDSQRVRSLVIATTSESFCDKNEVTQIANSAVDSRLDESIEKKIDEKINEVFKSEHGPAKLAIEEIETNLEATIESELKTKLSTAAGAELATDAKNLLQSTIDKELEQTRNSAIISLDEDNDLNPKKLGEMLVKSMNVSRKDIPECNSGKEFGKSAVTFAKLPSPREGRNKDRRFWRISLKGKLSKRALFSSFAREGQSSLKGLSLSNEVPNFLKRDYRTAEHLGSVLRKKFPDLKSRSSVNSKNAQIDLMMAKKSPRGSKFATVCSSKPSEGHPVCLTDFYDIEKKDDKMFEKLYTICQDIIDSE